MVGCLFISLLESHHNEGGDLKHTNEEQSTRTQRIRDSGHQEMSGKEKEGWVSSVEKAES